MNIVLNSFGASIRKENGVFIVSTAQAKQNIHPRDVTTISVSKGARISSDAVLLAIENEIDVLFVDGLGMPKGRVWSPKFGSISDIRRQQLEFLYSKDAVEWVKDIVLEDISIRPNPTSGNFEINLPLDELLTVRVISLDGKIKSVFQGREKITGTIEDPGLYILQIMSSDGASVFKKLVVR